MGRHLSRGFGSCWNALYPSPSVGAERRHYAEPRRLGARTGQGRQPRSGRASARALTRSTSSPPANRRHRQSEWSSMPRDAELSRRNLVFGGIAKTHDHDAVMRISGEAPGQRDHSVGRRKPGTSAVHRHLGSRSDIHLSLENADTVLFYSALLIVSRHGAQYLRGSHRSLCNATARSTVCAPGRQSLFSVCELARARSAPCTIATARCPSGT
jgi:hypothetical protein